MFTSNPQYKPIKFKVLKEYKMQSIYLVNQISKLEDLAEVAILYRNNSSAIILIDSFDKAKIPFYMKDSDNRFFTHWVVQDILNFMRLSYDFSRIDVFETIYSKFNAYIKKSQFEELKKVYNNQSLTKESVFEILLSFVKLEDYQIEKVKKLKDSYNKIKTASPKSVLQIIRNELGYESSLEFICKSTGYNFEYALEIVNTLEIISESTNTMIEFANRIKYLDSLMKSSKFNKGENAVTFSTFHSSKGLEFNTVFMIDLIEGIIPSTSKSEKSNEKSKILEEELQNLEEEMEEEVRLFYVGMTRAKLNLELVSYLKKFDKTVKRSEFFKQVQNLVTPAEAPQPKPKKLFSKQEPKNNSIFNSNTIQDRTLLKVGLVVKHILFGQGEIISCNSEVLEIRFESEIKKFQVSVCLEHGYIEKLE